MQFGVVPHTATPLRRDVVFLAHRVVRLVNVKSSHAVPRMHVFAPGSRTASIGHRPSAEPHNPSVRTHARLFHLIFPSVALSVEAMQNGASQGVHVYNAHFLHLRPWSFFFSLHFFFRRGTIFRRGGLDAGDLGIGTRRKGRSRMSPRRLLGLDLLCFVAFRGGRRFNSEDPTAESGIRSLTWFNCLPSQSVPHGAAEGLAASEASA